MADSALKLALIQYRTKLVADTALANIPENLEPEDLPVSNLNQTFALILQSPTRDLRSFGGGTYDYEADAELIIVWRLNLDIETLSDLIANDMVDADVSMLKDSNRDPGTVKVTKSGGTIEGDENSVMARMLFTIRCRETRDFL